MAHSKSIARAQDIVNCHLCEKEPKIKWKCLDCILNLMCHTCCDKVHPKFKNAQDHQIIDVKDVGQGHERSEVNFNNIKCTSHSKETCCLYCESCELLVCPVCIAKGHKGHQFLEIQAFYQRMYGKLKDKVQRLDLKEEHLSNKEEELNKYENEEKLKCNRLLDMIKERKKILVRMADDYASKLSKEADDRMKSIENSVSNERVRMRKSKQEIYENKTHVKQILHSQDGKDFFMNKDATLKYEPQDYKLSISGDTQIPEFTPGNFSTDVFGSLQYPTPQRMKRMQMNIRKTYTTELSHCHGLAACDGGHLWIDQENSIGHDTLLKVLPQRDILKTVSTPPWNTMVYDIKAWQSNLFIADGTSTLKFVSTEDKIYKSQITAPNELLIVGFDFTDDGKVVMGTRNSHKPNDVQLRSAVVRITLDGKLEMIYEYDQNKRRIFFNPRKVCCTRKGNFLVIDRPRNLAYAKIICLSYEGNVINTFNGKPNSDGKPMDLSAIIRAPSDNVIACDYNNGILYLLDINGELISSFDTATLGITHPHSLAFRNPNTLYIGCRMEDNTEKAKLHEIEFAERS